MGEAKRKMVATADTPYQRVKGGWRLQKRDGVAIVVRTEFQPHVGHLVRMSFQGFATFNLMTAQSARNLARRAPPDLSDKLIRTSVEVDKLNRDWRMAGRPISGEVHHV